jgi:hypothetical protein
VRALAWQFSDGKTGYPAFHYDDWEGYQVRIDPAGRAAVRASSHGGYQHCKERSCRNVWGPANGWTRVSYGSHAGHVPGVTPGAGVRERSTTATGLRLVPIEGLDHAEYERRDEEVSPPWEKPVYRDPRSPAS